MYKPERYALRPILEPALDSSQLRTLLWSHGIGNFQNRNVCKMPYVLARVFSRLCYLLYLLHVAISVANASGRTRLTCAEWFLNHVMLWTNEP